MRARIIHFIAGIFLIVPLVAQSQNLIKGIVVDSVTLENLTGVHIKVKNERHVAVTDANGIFVIVAKPTDTLVFTFVGYAKATQSANKDEEIMFIRMRDQSTLLKEITIRDTRMLKEKYIESKTLSTTKPLKASASAGSVNFAYFTKLEKEKRKLVAMINELERARAYIEIVNDPEIREKIIANYSLTETKYYELLAIFNQTHDSVIHSSNPALILNTLFTYFEDASGN